MKAPLPSPDAPPIQRTALSVTLIMPTFNSARTIRGALQSVANQTRMPDEIIVIDGGSTDDTLRIVAEFEQLRPKVFSAPDDGPYDAMNKGIARADGDLVAILNSDDRWLSETLAIVEDAFQQGGERLGIVHGNVCYRLTDGGTRAIRPTRGAARWAGLGLPSSHPATFVRREVYRRVGPYDLRFPICADQDFIYRCLWQGVPDAHVDRVLTEMHQGGMSATTDFRDEMDALFARFPLPSRWVAKFLWAGLGRNVNYFSGWTDLTLASALLRASAGFARQTARLLAGKN